MTRKIAEQSFFFCPYCSAPILIKPGRPPKMCETCRHLQMTTRRDRKCLICDVIFTLGFHQRNHFCSVCRPVGLYLASLFDRINQRCIDRKINKYEYYGGRGIQNHLSLNDLVCLWRRDHAENLNRPSLDRKNSDGHYTVENCQFIELVENTKKRRSSGSRWDSPAKYPVIRRAKP